VLASAVAWWSLAARIATPSSTWATAVPASLEAVRAWLKRPRVAQLDPALTLGMAHGLLGVATAVVAVTLVFDPRYRDFPIAIVLPAAVALMVRLSFAGTATTQDRPMERTLAWVMLACVPAGLLIEQWVNLEAIAWAFTLALVAWPWARAKPQGHR
jgi:hypothetical protein